MKIISIFNQKGGVSKTTSVKEIGEGLSRLGKKVLLIDNDPQGNLSKRYGVSRKENTIADLLEGKAKYQSCITEINPNLHIIPSHMKLMLFRYYSVPNKQSVLKMRLYGLKGYDYILIDCNPDFGDYTMNALSISKKIYVPVQVESMALEGVDILRAGVNLAKQHVNPELEIGGVFCTMLDARINDHKIYEKEVKEFFKEKAFETTIRRNADVEKANGKRLSVYDLNINSSGASDFINLVLEIIKREEGEIFDFVAAKEIIRGKN